MRCCSRDAQKAKKYAHSCKMCFGNQSPADLYALIQEESDRYLQSIEKQQKWNLSEPALQFLVLPSRSNTSLPKYNEQATYLNPSHCRLCLQEVNDLEKHLSQAHPHIKDMQAYRQDVFSKVIAEWPQAISPQVLRSRLAAFKGAMTDNEFVMQTCAVCARRKRKCKLRSVVFPSPNRSACPSWLPWSASEWQKHGASWYNQLDDIFNIDRYLTEIFQVEQRLLEATQAVFEFQDGATQTDSFDSLQQAENWLGRVQKWAANLKRNLSDDSVCAPGDSDSRWLLYKSSSLTVNDTTGEISCLLCKHCYRNLSQVDLTLQKNPKLKMPRRARANGMWRGPDPDALKALSYAECKVINLARVYVSIKRVFLDRSSFAGTSTSETPKYHQKNVVAYPQSPDAALGTLGLSPESLSQTLLVQFVGGNRQALRFHPDLQVSVRRLREAFLWLSENCWPFMDLTKKHAFWDSDEASSALTCLLQEYETSVGDDSGGIPAEILQAASEIPADRATVTLQGPANCTALDAENVSNTASRSTEDVDENTTHLHSDAADVQCAAALNGGLDDFGPLQLWDAIMEKYKVAQLCQQELRRLDSVKDKSNVEFLKQKEAVAIAEAVEGISRLHHKDVFKKLEQFVQGQSSSTGTLLLSHDNIYLRSGDPFFWCKCFVRLFPRGDCSEKCPERCQMLNSWEWAKCLLTRADFDLWRLDVEFVASVYNVFLRREQMNAVEAYCKSPLFTVGEAEEVQQLSCAGLVSTALASGDVNSIRSLLKKKNLDKPIKKAFQAMQIQQRTVRGSEGERDKLLPHFTALRLWSGCSSLFFTLNPHDIRSPLTVLLCQQDSPTIERRFSLDLTDQEASEYLSDFLQDLFIN